MGCGVFSKEYELYTVCRQNHIDDAIRLLEAGAQPTYVEIKENNYTPLIWACKHGQNELCELLLKYGANVNDADLDGDQPIHYAASGGSVELCKLFVARGAKIAARNNKGNTPLHLAAIVGRLETVGYLIEAGANIDARNEEDLTALDVAHPYRCATVLAKVQEGYSFAQSIAFLQDRVSKSMLKSKSTNDAAFRATASAAVVASAEYNKLINAKRTVIPELSSDSKTFNFSTDNKNIKRSVSFGRIQIAALDMGGSLVLPTSKSSSGINLVKLGNGSARFSDKPTIFSNDIQQFGSARFTDKPPTVFGGS